MAEKTEKAGKAGKRDGLLERAFAFLESQERESALGGFLLSDGRDPVALSEYRAMLWGFVSQGEMLDLDFACLMSSMAGMVGKLRNQWQFVEVNDAVHRLMEGGVPSMDEANRVLMPLFVKATGEDGLAAMPSDPPYAPPAEDGPAFDPRPDSIAGMNIVLSGEFKSGKKNDVATFFGLLKANVSDGPVTKLTDAVLVGSKGSKCWSHGSYGNKIDKAIELRKKGFHVLLLKEEDFFCSTTATSSGGLD